MLKRVGLDIPTIEVRFERLNVEAEVHVGSRALPSLLNFSFNMLEVSSLLDLILIELCCVCSFILLLDKFTPKISLSLHLSLGNLRLSSHSSK